MAHAGCCGPLCELVREDVAANIDKAAPSLRDIALGLLWARSVQAALLHRLAHAAWRRRLTPVSEVLLRMSQLLFSVDISYRAQIGPGLVLRHCMNVVIGSEARIGRRVVVFQGVTVGKRLTGSATKPDGMATIGDGVTLGAGCVLLGPVVVGDGAMIGANAVVTKNVPDGGIVTN